MRVGDRIQNKFTGEYGFVTGLEIVRDEVIVRIAYDRSAPACGSLDAFYRIDTRR